MTTDTSALRRHEMPATIWFCKNCRAAVPSYEVSGLTQCHSQCGNPVVKRLDETIAADTFLILLKAATALAEEAEEYMSDDGLMACVPLDFISELNTAIEEVTDAYFEMADAATQAAEPAQEMR